MSWLKWAWTVVRIALVHKRIRIPHEECPECEIDTLWLGVDEKGHPYLLCAMCGEGRKMVVQLGDEEFHL